MDVLLRKNRNRFPSRMRRAFAFHSFARKHAAGAGKTFTMSGGKQSFKQRGIIPRALGQLFAEVKAMPDREARVSVQYLEVRAAWLVGDWGCWQVAE